MAEANRYEGEIHLPETIIQHIQSLLTAKEAAGTTLLSKSWYTAWLTRPNLDFDFRDGSFGTDLAFFTFVEKTIERYERLNLKVESFRLWMRDVRPEEFELGKRDSFFFASELITRARKLGSTDLDYEVDAKEYWLGSTTDYL